MLRKQAVTYGAQWDKFLPGMLWVYRNTPHDTTEEKPSLLLFDIDCRTPTEAALLPPVDSEPTNDFTDYRQELVHTLSSSRATNLGNAQQRYKSLRDKNVHDIELKIGDLVLVYFPKEDSGKNHKLSLPWHGPYRVIEKRDLDITLR